MTEAFTPTQIEDRMEEAARTLRRLPNPPGSTPRGHKSGWPEYVQERGAYGYNETRIRIVPSARDIKHMEECFEWLSWLEPDDARIVWSRAEGMRWRQIGIRAGCVRQTAWRRWVAALVVISKRLNQKHKTKPAPAARKRAADEPVVKADADAPATLL
ncbi:MAG: helix-turn-helix domain-containing protein [Alphaproteobacteria bacterium]|nr:helix-turn-helix domain-containing protein [Alphaproteobacteria bacterium]